jgi:modulator of FtsH protease
MAVLRKTYFLLSLTLLFSAATAYYSMSLNLKPNFIILLVGMYGLYFLTMSLRNSRWGLAAIFAYTGFMGYILGPMLNFYIKGFSNGPQMVGTAVGATGALFLGLSFYTIVKRKNYSHLGGFLFAAILMAMLGMIANMFLQIPMLQILVSGAFAVISCGYILYTTSMIIQGGEKNFIMATISLYVAIFNLFISLLQLLAIFGGGRR